MRPKTEEMNQKRQQRAKTITPLTISVLAKFMLLAATAGASPAQEPASSSSSTNGAAQLPDVVVSAPVERVSEYGATNAVTAMKMDVPLLETPQAVSLVPRTLLDDQGVRRLEDALRNVSGVTVGGYYQDWDYYRIRGFDAAFTTYWDGLRGDYGMNAETFGLERVEVVKGPASALYGQGPLGGMVNLVSKRPRAEEFADVQFTVGSLEYYEPAVDVNTTLDAEKTVYARITALYRDQESFVDFAKKDRVFVAPALTWEINPKTSLTLLTHYQRDESLMAMPLPARGTVLPNPNGDIPMERFIGDPDFGNAEQWKGKLGYELRHEFTEDLMLRQNLSYNHMSQEWPDLLYPSHLDPDGRTLYRYPYDYREDLNRLGVDTSLGWKIETGPVEHQLTGGVDYYRTRSDSESRQIDYSHAGSYTPIDLFDPNYDTALPPYASFTQSITEASLWGLYLQDHIRYERLSVGVGGRFDWTESNDESAEGFSPRAGLSYEILDGVAVYGNYSRSFNPQWFSLEATGKPVDPETGDNFEVGVKASLLDGRLTGLLAAYHLTRRDVATLNLGTADPFDSIAAGEQRSQGIELEGAYQLLPGWDLIAAYTYTDAEIREDNRLPVGTALAGVPEHAFSAWTKFTLQDGALKGLGFGIGGRYYTEQKGDATYSNIFTLPAYGVMDAAVYYKRGRFYSQVNANNVLDEKYFAGAYNELYVMPGEPINVRATVGWSF